MFYALTNMILLDGRPDMTPRNGRAVLVRDGRITNIVPEDSVPAGCRQIALVATLSPAIPFLGINDKITGVSKLAMINARALFRNMLECIDRCRKAGIPVGIGTDTGCPYVTQYDFWRELWYFRRFCGADMRETLYRATLGNAEIAGIADETGSIEVGKSADFVVLSGNPLLGADAARDPEAVIIRGRIIRNAGAKKFPKAEEILDECMAYFAAGGRI